MTDPKQNLDYTELTYLLVDDSPIMLSIVQRALNAIGVTGTIHKVDSAKKALDLLKQVRVDFILSDWNMPGMTGLELLRHIRAMDACMDTPFVMLTAEALRRNKVEAGMSGVSGYLTKPFQPDTLKKLIQKILADTPASS